MTWVVSGTVVGGGGVKWSCSGIGKVGKGVIILRIFADVGFASSV